MPASESWMQEGILRVVWEHPLSSDELYQCFTRINAMLNENNAPAHVLFDITATRTIPHQAPIFAVRSGFLTNEQTDEVVVVGKSTVAKMLAGFATKLSRKSIAFFRDTDSALAHLSSS